jgi:small-conductance mechanosensitive channel
MQSELRKQLVIFAALASIIILILLVLPYLEPLLVDYLKTFFPLVSDSKGQFSDSETSKTTISLVTNFIKVSKIILSMILVIAIVRILSNIVTNTILRNTGSYEITTLLRNVFSIVIYIVAFTMLVKSQFDTDLTTFFAGSTIIAVVLGLALQDTLGNLFAGISMQADQPFQIGDVIDIPGKGTGVVENLSWRGVKIRTFQNKIIIISNSILGKEAIEVAPKDNLNARLAFFNTLYSASPTITIQLIRDVVRQVENVSGKIRPIVRIRNLGDNGLDWEVKYWLEDYSKYNDTDALVRQRIWYAFQREGIHFAFPTRTLYVESQSLEPDFAESVNEIFERLCEVPLFAPLTDDETLKLAESCEAKIFSPNEPIVRKGQDGNSMFVIHRGSVNIQVKEEGIAKTVATLHEGEVFGEMGLFTGETRAANVIAAEETEVLEINHTAVKPLFVTNPSLVEALSKTIAERTVLLSTTKETASIVENQKDGVFSSIKKYFGLN